MVYSIVTDMYNHHQSQFAHYNFLHKVTLSLRGEVTSHSV